jgi:hypothetical protein
VEKSKNPQNKSDQNDFCIVKTPLSQLNTFQRDGGARPTKKNRHTQKRGAPTYRHRLSLTTPSLTLTILCGRKNDGEGHEMQVARTGAKKSSAESQVRCWSPNKLGTIQSKKGGKSVKSRMTGERMCVRIVNPRTDNVCIFGSHGAKNRRASTGAPNFSK